MKHICISLLLSITLGAGCKKSLAPYMSTGSIIGPDPRVPACGGGTWIKVDGHPNPENPSTGYYDMGKIPAGFQIPATAIYPIKVELDYTVNSHCSIYIDISRIKILN
jgi:hypothetical protein